MKDGRYGLYKGKEYRLVKPKRDSISLVSHSKSDLENGFDEYDEGIYVKVIKKTDLEDVYRIHSSAVFRGERFGILAESDKNNTYTLSGNEAHAEKFSMHCHNKGEFSMEVPRGEVEIIEKITPLTVEDLG